MNVWTTYYPFLIINLYTNVYYFNRLLCRYSVILVWREPFNYHNNDEAHANANKKYSIVINTLLACLNEDEIA